MVTITVNPAGATPLLTSLLTATTTLLEAAVGAAGLVDALSEGLTRVRSTDEAIVALTEALEIK